MFNVSKNFNLLTKGVGAVGALVIEGGVTPNQVTPNPAVLFGMAQNTVVVSVPAIDGGVETFVTIPAATWGVSKLNVGDLVMAVPAESITPVVLTRCLATLGGDLQVFFANVSATTSTPVDVAVLFTQFAFGA